MDEVTRADTINVWSRESAPERLQELLPQDAEWIALVPGSFVSSETEAIFLRWHSDAHPVIRQILRSGAVVFAGRHPDARTMLASPQQSWNIVAIDQRRSTR